MSQIKIIPTEDLDKFVDILINAYPIYKIHTPEAKEKKKQAYIAWREKLDTIEFYGCYREGSLVGGMILFNFQMNFHGKKILVGGVGDVAVDLNHKKKGVAKEMIQYFHDHFRGQGAAFTMLYPFRSDFYKQMGYGYGPIKYQYDLKPGGFPRAVSPHQTRYLSKADIPPLLALYEKVAQTQHGVVFRSELDWEHLLDRHQRRWIGTFLEGELVSYLSFTYKHGVNFLDNDLHVTESIYSSPPGLYALLNFLHTQHDQINRVLYNTFDPNFHFLLSNPRSRNENIIPSVYHPTRLGGIGLMYRVIDCPTAIQLTPYDPAIGVTLQFDITDTFLPENNEQFTVRFSSGRAILVEKSAGPLEVPKISMNIDNFSSLFMGVISFDALNNYGLVKCSNPEVIPLITKLFTFPQSPVNYTDF